MDFVEIRGQIMPSLALFAPSPILPISLAFLECGNSHEAFHHLGETSFFSDGEISFLFFYPGDVVEALEVAGNEGGIFFGKQYR